MKTEKDIRTFMQENKMNLADGDRFMADLARQIDLLPVPAALDGSEMRKRQEALDAVSAKFAAMKKQYAKKAVLLVSFACIVCSCAAFALTSLLPASWLESIMNVAKSFGERLAWFFLLEQTPLYVCLCLCFDLLVIVSASAVGTRIFSVGGRR